MENAPLLGGDYSDSENTDWITVRFSNSPSRELIELPNMPSPSPGGSKSSNNDEKERLVEKRHISWSQRLNNVFAHLWDQLKYLFGIKWHLSERNILFGEENFAVTPKSASLFLRKGASHSSYGHASFCENKINNCKYSPISFIPLVLLFNFKNFLNIYFLVIACSQFISELKIGPFYTYWAPLIFVLSISLVKEAYMDIRRLLRDRVVNSTEYERLTSTGLTEWVKSSDLKVGDIISIRKNVRIPADLLLLRTSEKTGSCFIRTDQLDGETDWKLRLAVGVTQQLASETDLLAGQFQVIAEPPKKDIYHFEGVFQQFSQSDDVMKSGEKTRLELIKNSKSYEKAANKQQMENNQQQQRTRTTSRPNGKRKTICEESISLENCLWSSTILATGSVWGLILYTGKETRSVLNTSQARMKRSSFERRLNGFVLVLFCLLFSSALAVVFSRSLDGSSVVLFVRYVIIFSNVVPSSVIVSLEIAYMFMSYLINSDKDMPGAQVRSLNMSQELAKMQLLLSDKTGTLTKNEMIMKKLHLGSACYIDENSDELTAILRRRLAKRGLLARISAVDVGDEVGADRKVKRGRLQLSRHVQERSLEAAIALALCHNVSPVYDNDQEQNERATAFFEQIESLITSNRSLQQPAVEAQYDELIEVGGDTASTVDEESRSRVSDSNVLADEAFQLMDLLRQLSPNYQASSPDEVALVNYSEQVGLTLVKRDVHEIWLRGPESVLQTGPSDGTRSAGHRTGCALLRYKILAIFPFTSETKRMGILVEDLDTGEITFFMKGADSVMSNIVQYSDWLEEEVDNMAREGLRTLVVGRKRLSRDHYEDFAKRYKQAQLSIGSRQANILAVQESLERDLELLCVTGVEDKLQENVRDTLETLANAGIRVWMLTGDKKETALNIARSSCLIGKTMRTFEFKEVYERMQILQELNELRRNAAEVALMISGKSLQFCQQFYEYEFVELAVQTRALVVYRCSPTQKAAIATMLRKHTKLKIAAIGDGGNDVSMIQVSDIGFGVEGKEGLQASLAADFSLREFQQVTRLTLVHGRYSLLNSAAMSFFIIHRGAIISVMQIAFTAVLNFAAVYMFPPILVVGYSTIFTSLPVFSLLLDRDVRPEIALKYPELYRDLVKGRAFDYKIFFVWLLMSIFQGLIMWLSGTGVTFNIGSSIGDLQYFYSTTFTALLLTEYVNILVTMHRFSWLVVLVELLSFLAYVITIFIFMGQFFYAYQFQRPSFYLNVFLVILISVSPLVAFQFIRRRLRPTVHDKLSPS